MKMKAGLGRKWMSVLFIIYLIILFRITVFRSTFGLEHMFQNGRIILSFFNDYIELIRRGNWFSFIYLFAGNIIWFVPFGMYLQYRGKCRNLFWAAAYGFLLSLLIETLQFVFGTGYSELDDLILNTLGTWFGAFMVRIFIMFYGNAIETGVRL